MLRLLNQAFNIKTQEWPRVLLLCLMHFLANGGVIWSLIITEAAFLRNVGVVYLPWVFVASPLVSIVAIAAYSAFADRVSDTALLIAILLIGALSFGGGRVVFALGWPIAAYAVWYPLTLIFIDIFFTLHWGTYINSFYDTQAAKRIFPVVSAAARIAAIVAGATITILNRLAPSDIMLIWAGLMLAVALLAWRMPAILKQRSMAAQAVAAPAAIQKTGSYFANIREGFRYVVQSAFLRWMALATLCIYVLFALLSYEGGKLFLNELQTVERISSLTGLLNSLGNLLMFPILLFGLSRIIGRIGVGNASLIFPFGTLAIGGALIAAPGVPTAGLAYFDRTAFRVTFHATFDSLLYNAVPLRVKGRTRAFITGLVVPLGTLLGGLLLLLLPALPADWWWVLPALISTLALAYFGCALAVRRQYGRALITMLEQEDFSFLLEQDASSVAIGDAMALETLKQKLARSQSHELTLFTAKLLAQLGGAAVVPALEQAARTAPDARTRAALLDLLIAAELRGPSIRQLYEDLVRDTDPHVRRAALAGLEQLAGAGSEAFLALALEMLHDTDIAVRAQVLPALARSGDFFYLAPAVQMLNQLLDDPDPQQRAHAVRVLTQLDDVRIIRSLLRHLSDISDEVRLQAIEAIATLANGAIHKWVRALVLKQMGGLVHDPVERVRQVTLSILGRCAVPEAYPALVEALADESPAVRATAADALAQIGRPAIATLRLALEAGDPLLRKMAAVALSRIDRGAFGALIEAQIDDDLRAIYCNHGRLQALAPSACYPSIAVLQSALREQNHGLADEIFYLLAAAHEGSAVRVIAESLRSGDPRVRANAAEALESLSSPQVARLAAPLFEPDQQIERLRQIGAERWDIRPPDTAGAIKDLQHDPDQPWLRALATFTLGELGATLRPPAASANGNGQPSSPEGQDGRRARRARAAALLDALADGPATATMLVPSMPAPLSFAQIEALLSDAYDDPAPEVRQAAQIAWRIIDGHRITELKAQGGAIMLSTIEKVLFLKEVPFFQGMTVDQLKALATVCEEEMFAANSHVFTQGDPGGALHVVVSGRVGIEQERRKGSFARLATIEAHAYFGEMNLFDDSPRSVSAIALQDTLTLRLRREPLIALARRQPDLSLELINVLSQRLREANDRIAELTRTKPRELHKLYDQFETSDE
jgi:CRP/FNR family transcriptional regulator, cyclic AMP receptor protein